MKRQFNFMVKDDSDDEHEEDDIKLKIPKIIQEDETLQVETPKDHHDCHPTLLSPFQNSNIVKPQQFPKKATEDEHDILPKEYYNTYIARTDEQCKEEREAPQRSLKWKEARKFCLTASDFGSATQNNPYCSADDLVQKKLWQSFDGNDATKWGTFCEPKAGEAFLAWAQKTLDKNAILHEYGLLKWSSIPYLAVSPDGVLEWKDKEGIIHYDLVEFKCPTRTSTDGHPYKKYLQNTPPYYRDQMLGIWGLVNSNNGIDGKKLENIYFVVWQPTSLWITKHIFKEEEWTDLFLKLKKWYFTKFLPSLVWYYNGLLEDNEIKPTTGCLDLRTFITKNNNSIENKCTNDSNINSQENYGKNTTTNTIELRRSFGTSNSWRHFDPE